MNKGDSTSFKEKLSKSWGNFVLWFLKLTIEQRVLFLIGVALVFFSFLLTVKSNPAMICGTILIILAILNPSTIKDFALEWGKGGPKVSLRRVAPQEESEILKEAAQKNPPPEIKKEAEKLFEAAEKRREEERAPEDYLALAVKAWEDKNFGEGLGWAYSGLNLNPKNDETRIELFNTLGMLYQDLKSYYLAEENYKKALEIDKKSDWIHYNLGSVYFDQKKYDDAEKAFNEVLRLDPDFDYAQLGLGALFYQQKNFPEAELKFREVIRLNSHESYGHSHLGFLLFDTERYEKALTQFNVALEIKFNSDNYAGKAISLSKLGRQEEALSAYKTAVSKDSKYLDLTRMRDEELWSEQALEAARELIDRL